MTNKNILKEDKGKTNLWITKLMTATRILHRNSVDGTAKERRKTVMQILDETNIWETMYLDDLTWLYNKNALGEIKRNNEIANNDYSVIMIDVNKFKEINSKYLHSGWDLVLQKIWEVIHSSIRTNMWDIAFRPWGDEFLVLIWEWDIELEKIVSRIENKINKMELYIDWDKIDISLSFWIHKKDKLSLNDSIEKADAQLENNKGEEWKAYRAKEIIESLESPELTKELINTGLDKLTEEEVVEVLQERIDYIKSPKELQLLIDTAEKALSKIKEAV